MKVKNPMIIHYVHDMQRAIDFYQGVFDVEVLTQSPGWSTLGFGSIELALHILSPGHIEEQPIPHAGVNFELDDSIPGTCITIEDMQRDIEHHGGKLVWLREPETFVPVRVASFIDSEGNGFELRQQVSE